MMIKQVISELMTDQDMTALGLEIVAYVKPVEVEGDACFGIYAADGTEITVVSDRDVAFAAVRQQDLEPLSVH
ncbi:DUF1150 family protein [Kiloniella litopenaei]|uniref:DUF1150 family protein n=1 Tax=Kiloniella litopenaei TaxID=1549748 RepID=A0A0M2R7R8_9PROT|nr:DUF1150 family protein [Kiloniella litopenaei]KKJ77962.1 hypothetical protein WH95_05990 [Kiloniella litopenaei]